MSEDSGRESLLQASSVAKYLASVVRCDLDVAAQVSTDAALVDALMMHVQVNTEGLL